MYVHVLINLLLFNTVPLPPTDVQLNLRFDNEMPNITASWMETDVYFEYIDMTKTTCFIVSTVIRIYVPHLR